MTEPKNLSTNTPANVISIDRALPNLHHMQPSKLALNSSYWTPASAGDVKLCVFLGFERSEYIDQKSGESIALKCALIIEQKRDLSLVKWRNGACQLVAVLENAVDNGNIVPGISAIRIEYTGKSPTKSGRFLDCFDVKVLTSAEADDDLKPPFSQP